ncbi:hypothetical protein PHB09_074 [Pseudomonas phage PHB09]|uniref:Lipoprotein n=1 Tax=Pseudomonas phage PHB09 TaxID=2867265 RepID=A0AAE9BMQ2_9CAUD|nr:hypothetical protein QGX10_gp074 [Pseudomonas phage PHB09]UAV84570.1 hypothetical protein PHB09_074 [Pseudomonas phage PHB09]
MKKLFLAALLAASLSGCKLYYTLEEVQKSKQACAEIDGQFNAEVDSYQGVWVTYCTVDGIRYSYNRGNGDFIGGMVK